MSEWERKFYDALGPLGWGFDEGDDGDIITLALDEIDSLLRELAALQDIDAEDLPELLRGAGVAEDDAMMVEQLYAMGRESSYGEGLTEEGVEEVNGIAQDVASLLETFMGEHRSRRRRTSRKRARKKTGTKRSPKKRDASK